MNYILEQNGQVLLLQAYDFQQVKRYVVCYGLQITRHNSYTAALVEFSDCVNHQRHCNQQGHTDD